MVIPWVHIHKRSQFFHPLYRDLGNLLWFFVEEIGNLTFSPFVATAQSAFSSRQLIPATFVGSISRLQGFLLVAKALRDSADIAEG
jgi:hypothetical protein